MDPVQALSDTIRFAVDNEHCGFYRDHLGDDPLPVETMADVRALPTLTKETLPRDGNEFLFVPEDDIAVVKPTSGTTGDPMVQYMSERDHEVIYQRKQEARWDALFDEPKRVLDLVSTDIAAYDFAYLHTAPHIPVVGDIHDTDYTAALARSAGVDVIRTSPSQALKIGRTLRADGFDMGRVESLLLAFEPVTTLHEEQLQELYPNATISHLYGLGEAGNLGFQCDQLAGTRKMHTYHSYDLVELVDPDSGDPVDEGERGEIIVSTLWTPSAKPMIRYRTGDLGRLIERESSCPCGRGGPILTVEGRIDANRIILGDIVVYRDSIDAALDAVSTLHADRYRIHVHERKRDGTILPYLRLEIVPTPGASLSTGIEDRLAAMIMRNLQITAKRTWADAVERDVLGEIEVDLADSEDDEFKSRILVDHRIND